MTYDELACCALTRTVPSDKSDSESESGTLLIKPDETTIRLLKQINPKAVRKKARRRSRILIGA